MAERNGTKNLLQVNQLLPITESQPIGPRSNAVALNVRFGSKADICSAKRHVRFAPESRHVQRTSPCPLCANSGHSVMSEVRPF